jgi:hypothetical protein
MGLGWRQACQVGSGRLSSLLGGSGDGDVGGGGQGVGGMGALHSDAGEEPVEAGPNRLQPRPPELEKPATLPIADSPATPRALVKGLHHFMA